MIEPIKTYKVIISNYGKQFYKGGNIEVLDKILNKTFTCKPSLIEGHLYNLLNNSGIGWASKDIYDIEELKGGNTKK